MKRLLHILILVMLGLSMSKCKCSDPQSYPVAYKIGIINSANSKITGFEYMLNQDEYQINAIPPIIPRRFIVNDNWLYKKVSSDRDNKFFFKIYFQNEMLVDSSVLLKGFESENDAPIYIDIIINEDFTLTIKQYPALDSSEVMQDRLLSF